MLAQNYDIITVGGGIAASALAKAMAEQGARVLVLERETYIPSSRASAPPQHTKILRKTCGHGVPDAKGPFDATTRTEDLPRIDG